jgi:hypothetical protein
MTRPALHLIAILAAALSLSACAPQPRNVAFNEASFTHYAGSGTGTITGTAFTILRDQSTFTANEKAHVRLMPDNEYTREIATRVYDHGEKLLPADPRFQKYVRKISADSDGHFVFNHVVPGHYFVSCHLWWTYPSTSTDSDGNITDTEAQEDQWVYAHVSIKNGQTIEVTGWAQGR